MITEDLEIWADDKVPVVIVNDVPTETKDFQVWVDSIVPYADIYDNLIPPRRRVFEF